MTRCPVSVRRLLPALPALLVVLTGCGAGPAQEAAAAPPVCAAPAALPAGTAPETASEAGRPRPVGARDDRELSGLTPEQAALVQQLRQAEQAGHGEEGSRAQAFEDAHPAEGHAAGRHAEPAATVGTAGAAATRSAGDRHAGAAADAHDGAASDAHPEPVAGEHAPADTQAAAPAPCAPAQGEAAHGEPEVERAPAEGGH